MNKRKLIFCEYYGTAVDYLVNSGEPMVIVPRNITTKEKWDLFNSSINSSMEIIVMDHWLLRTDHFGVDEMYHLTKNGTLNSLQLYTDKQLRDIHDMAKLSFGWWVGAHNE